MDKKEDFLDEIMRQCAEEELESGVKTVGEYSLVVDPWKQFEEIKSVSLKDVLALAESYDWHRKGFSMGIAESLYLYNSKANIVKAEDKSLIVLPEAEVVIDLFNNEREDFIGPLYKDNADYYINEILKVIGSEGYVFYSLNDALRANNILQRVSPFSKYCIEKDAVITNGISILKEYGWRFIMDKLLHGNHNWVCSTTYLHAILKMQSSLIRYNVICYECLPYIREDKEYCIETKWQLDNHIDAIDELDDNKQIAIFACYCPSDETKEGWTGNTAVKFLGVYKLDKERSKIENHIAFKRYSDDKLYI